MDPFSIAGTVVGFTVAGVNFLLNTIGQSTSTYERLKECHTHLTCHKCTLETVQMRLRVWCSEWALLTPIGRTFDEIWGQDGHDRVNRILQCIQTKDAKVSELLFGKIDVALVHSETGRAELWHAFVQQGPFLNTITPAEGDRHKLRSILKSLSPQSSLRRPLPVIEPSFLARLDYAVITHTTLAGAIDALKTQVDNLERSSRDHFRHHHALLPTDTSADDDIVKLNLRAQKFWSNMSQLRDKLRPTQEAWALLLPPLQPSVFLDHVYMSLSFLNTPEGIHSRKKARKASTTYYLDNDTNTADRIFTSIVREANNVREENEAILTSSMRNLFESFFLQSEDDKLMSRKRITLQRAKTAFCLTWWSTVLAHHSRWMDCVCTCGVRYAIDRAAWPSTPSGMTPGAEGPSARWDMDGTPCFEVHLIHRPGCRTVLCSPDDRPHLLLARVLAEIGLAQPVNLHAEAHKKPFEIWTSATEHDYFDTYELLDLLRKCTSHFYVQAVAKCLEWDERRAFQPKLGAQDVKRYSDHVLTPLYKHFQAVRWHVAKFERRGVPRGLSG